MSHSSSIIIHSPLSASLISLYQMTIAKTERRWFHPNSIRWVDPFHVCSTFYFSADTLKDYPLSIWNDFTGECSCWQIIIIMRWRCRRVEGDRLIKTCSPEIFTNVNRTCAHCIMLCVYSEVVSIRVFHFYVKLHPETGRNSILSRISSRFYIWPPFWPQRSRLSAQPQSFLRFLVT